MQQEQEPPSPEQQDPQMMNDGQEFDEMDLTPYEDDDDATLHRKLCAAKLARKRAEEDLKLLCNRIGLLKMEEGKVVKKIDETRKRAGQIMDQRDRNQKHLAEKMARQEQIRMDEAMRREMNLRNKESMQNQVKQSKDMARTHTKLTALDTKKEKEMNKKRNAD